MLISLNTDWSTITDSDVCFSNPAIIAFTAAASANLCFPRIVFSFFGWLSSAFCLFYTHLVCFNFLFSTSTLLLMLTHLSDRLHLLLPACACFSLFAHLFRHAVFSVCLRSLLSCFAWLLLAEADFQKLLTCIFWLLLLLFLHWLILHSLWQVFQISLLMDCIGGHTNLCLGFRLSWFFSGYFFRIKPLTLSDFSESGL